jgi:hypothetical protein
MAVDAGLWLSRRPQTYPQLRADARGCHGGVREELVERIGRVLIDAQIAAAPAFLGHIHRLSKKCVL